ncbi:MAG: nucleotidyltransferase domain-containing protein [Spirochaetales bacterium]|nr:nucleotidyltransferase domain-containing protein [Spirochaetales bacterium]
MEPDKDIERIKEIIIKTSHPEKIILFGSRATGNYSKDSDYDILVLKKDLKNERTLSREIYRALYNNKVKNPVDIIAVDSVKWSKEKDNKYLIYNEVNTSGIVLYG